MHPNQLDSTVLKSLLGQSQQAPAEVTQRLQWFIHFAECGSVSETCRLFGIARTTFYRWMKRLDVQDLRSLQDSTWAMSLQKVAIAQPVHTPAEVSPTLAKVFCENAAEPCPLCRLKSFNWTSFRSAAFITSILFNLALASLIVFTAMLEGQPTNAKAVTPTTLIPAEQQHQTSFLNSLLGIEIANAATGIYRPINYQGKLTNSGGVAIANGTYDLRFKIFSAASGGTPIWSETWSTATQKVTATGGLFSIALGTHVAMTGSVNFNSDSLFLQVEFDPGADGTFEEVFSPRRRFASVPYAHNANSVDGLDSTQFIRSDISYTSSGTITVSPRDAAKTGIDILSTAGTANVAALKISTQGANHIVFGTGAANYDTNLYRSAVATLKTDGNFSALGTLSGKTLIVSGNASVTGSLVVNRSISGATLEILGTASGQDLFATRSISGTHIYAASTFGGAGLADCDASGQTLNWDATTKRFICGVDDSAGSGLDQNSGDARYVKKSGDTMTGALIIDILNGNGNTLGLRIINTASGRHLHAEQTLTSSGTLTVQGAAKLKTTLTVLGTITGSVVHAERTLTSSGSLTWEGAASGSTLYVATSINGAGLADCDTAGTSKLLWDSSTGRFSCGTDQTGGIGTSSFSGGVLRLADDRYVKKSGDTMTGALAIYKNSGTSTGNTFVVDSRGLVYDASNKRVGIGTNAPEQLLHLARPNGGDAAIYFQERTAGSTSNLSAGPNSPSSTATDSAIGSYDWTNPGNVTASDDTRATVAYAASSGQSYYLKATNFGFSIPSDATVLGVVVEWEKSVGNVTSGSINDAASRIIKGGTIGATDKSDATNWPDVGSEAYTSYGSSSDLWGETWTYSDINNSGFGAAIAANCGGGCTLDAQLDHARITVYYSQPTGSHAYDWTIGADDSDSGKFKISNSGALGTRDFMTIDTSGNMLVNTGDVNVANGSLTVQNRVNFGGTTYYINGISYLLTTNVTTPTYTFASDANSGLYGLGNDVIGLSTGGVDRFRILSNGNIGIGSVSAPGSRLSVSGSVLIGRNIGSAQAQTGVLLEVLGTASGTNFYATKSVSGADLFAARSITGSHLYAASTFGGAGLGSCSNATASKLLYNSATKQFSCGTDQTGGGASAPEVGTSSFSGATLRLGDARYVKKQGDSMSGALVIDILNGNGSTLGLRIINTGSGRHLHAEQVLTSSGRLIVEGDATFDATTLFVDSVNNRVGVGTNAPDETFQVDGNARVRTGTFYVGLGGAGSDTSFSDGVIDAYSYGLSQGATLALNPNGGSVAVRKSTAKASLDVLGTISGSRLTISGNASVTGSLVVNKNISGAALEILGTASGADIFATRSISGTHLYAATTFGGAGLTSCSNATTSKLLYNSATKQFSCGTDQTGGGSTAPEVGTLSFSGAVLRLGDARYVKKQGDTMTGALVIDMLSGNGNTLGLRIINTASGRHLHAEQRLTSSGAIIWEGAGSGRSLDLGGGNVTFSLSGQTVFNALNRNVDFSIRSQTNNNAFFVDASTSRVGIGTNTLESAFEVVGSISGTTLIATGTGSKPLFFASAPWNSVGIGTATPGQKLTVSGGSILNVAGGNVRTLSGVNIGAQVNDVAIAGKYAYVASSNSPNFRIVDISNPLNPRTISSINFGYDAKAVAVAGKYVYLGTTTTTNEGLRVIDVSNPFAPLQVAKLDVGDNLAVQAITIVGNYAYIGKEQSIFTTNDFVIADISNPLSPKAIGSMDVGTSIGVYAVAVQGKYAYLGLDDDGFSANELRVIDISNPSRPLEKGGLSVGADINSIFVSGRLAYAGLASVSGNDFRIFDISNPASITTVGGLDLSTDVLSVDVAGKYAYLGLTSAAGNDFRVVDVSNPATPTTVGGADLSTSGRKVVIAGKYAYVGFPDTSGSDLVIYDINGIDAPSASIGSLGVEVLYVGRNVTVANTLNVLNSINVGVGGIKSDGMLSITVGSGSSVSGMTGAIIVNRGLSGAVLALDSWTRNASSSGGKINFVPHLLFGYRGSYDTNLFRSGTGQLTTSGSFIINDMRSQPLLKLESGVNSSVENVMEVYTKSTSAFTGPTERNLVWRMEGDGEVFADSAYNTSGADYAEWFHSSDNDMKPGEAVCLDLSKELTVKRCERSGDPNVMGIISTKPAFVGNRFGATENPNPKNAALVGLIGQLPAKAIVEDGQAIAVGDAMAAASKPGFIRKAKSGESTVGVALIALASGEGDIEILITRRNQSDLVEKIENEVTQSIAEMHIEDDVLQMVQTAMNGANINATVASAVQAQVQSLNLAAEINAILNQRLADGTLELGSSGSLQSDILTAMRSNSGALAVEDAVAARLGVVRSGTAALVVSGDLAVGGGLRVNNNLTVNGTLHAAAISGPIQVLGLFTPSASFRLGAIGFSGSTVAIGDIAVPGTLQVVGDVTVSGLTTFLGNVDVKGELIVNDRQAGYAIIPAGIKSVTVLFSTGFVATPVVTASPDQPVPFAVSRATATGFVIRIASIAKEDIAFSWLALSTYLPTLSQGHSAAGTLIPFHVDAQGRPYSEIDALWNSCIADPNAFDACRGYHQGSLWFAHPDIVQANLEILTFTYDATTVPPTLALPERYTPVVVNTEIIGSSSSVSSSESSSESSESSSSSQSSESSSEALSSSSSSEAAVESSEEIPLESSSSSEASESSAASTPDEPPPSDGGTTGGEGE